MKNTCIILLLLISNNAFSNEVDESRPALDLSFLSSRVSIEFVVLSRKGEDLTRELPFFPHLLWDFKRYYGSRFKKQINVGPSPFPKHYSFKLKSGDKYMSNILVIRNYIKEEYEGSPEGVKILDEILEQYQSKLEINASLVADMNFWVCSNLRYSIRKCD